MPRPYGSPRFLESLPQRGGADVPELLGVELRCPLPRRHAWGGVGALGGVEKHLNWLQDGVLIKTSRRSRSVVRDDEMV